MITSKDIAKKAGVSISTVSRVLSDDPHISEKTKAKVMKIVKKLNYIPDQNASNLKRGKKNVCGIIIPDSSNPFYTTVIKELSVLDNYKRKQMFVMFSEEDSDREFECIKTLLSTNIESLIYTPSSNSNPSIEEMVTNNKIPALQLYRKKVESLDSLVVDDAYGAYLATNELIKNGHKKILLVDYTLSVPTHRDDGYRRAFKENGLEVDEDYIVQLQLDDHRAGKMFEAFDKLQPTGVITTGSFFTTKLYHHITNKGLEIKKDISVVAYDNCDIAECVNLTCISHNIQEIATSISAVLQKRIKDKNLPPIHEMVKPFLLKRDSIKNIK